MSSRKRYGKFGPIVGAIDEGTSGARFMAFAAQTSEVLTYHQIGIDQHCPQDKWAEQDPMVIINAVKECIERTTDNLVKLDIDPRDIVAVGIANQRETTILWDKNTGKPFYNAILWLDTRTSTIADDILSRVKNKNPDHFKPLCGLPINPYFSALKIRWLIDNVPEVENAIKEDRCLFGTVDSWLIWNLTGGPQGGVHVTDVTNASRTMLMNLNTLTWDDQLCNFFAIPRTILPNIYSSSEIYGYIADGVLRGVPISGCLGDQQSALVGQMCLNKGEAKNTYGTGCFLLCNTGTVKVDSKHGLLTTVAYQLGRNAPATYAVEGSIATAGAALIWLRDKVKLFSNLSEVEALAMNAKSSSECYFVPAFSGLYAPYWRKDASSVLCNVIGETCKGDLVKATLEAVCFQTKDIIEAMTKDCGIPLQKILVDGGMTVNGYLMQLQADLCGIPVVRATISETTALGAAIVAGMAEGVNVWNLLKTPKLITDTFHPRIPQDERELRYHRWKMAIERSFDKQADLKSLEEMESNRIRRMYAAIGPAIYILVSFATVVLANRFHS